ncbi:MAG: hypothetical protein FWF44_04160 [Defluviitaleaceae bacterium]|nr:hypothetical protein [Defluviitaleaceae bacterium]
MPFSLKENEQDARERLRAFWAKESMGRPGLYVTADNPAYIKRAPAPGPKRSRTAEEKKAADYDAETHARGNDDNLKSTIFLAEAMPCFTLWWGSALTTVAVLAGGDYGFHDSAPGQWYEDGDSAWIEPMPDLFKREIPKFDPQSPGAVFLSQCMSRFAEVIGGRGYVNPPMMMDAMTTASMFAGPDELCLKMADDPGEVRRVCDRLTDIYIDGYEHFYNQVKSLGYGDTSNWLNVMAEGRSEAVQCDFSVMISPGDYKKFVMPDLERVTEYLDFSLYHLDGTEQMRFLDLLSTLPGLNGIQWNPQPGAGSPVKWIDAFKKIREKGLCLDLYCNLEEAKIIAKEVGPDGLYLALPRFATVEEAERAIKEIEDVC